MMVAAISEAAPTDPPPNPKTSSAHRSRPHLQNPSRPPLLPSEKDNGFVQRRSRGRQVSSKYMSPSPSSSSTSTSTSTVSSSASSRRCPSPLLSRSINSASNSTPVPAQKRAQSADRRRPITPRTSAGLPEARVSNAGSEVSAATRLLVTSTRSLSVSFQGEAFSLPISKTKTPASPSGTAARKATPERRRSTPVRGDQAENSKPSDQHRWPARTRQLSSGGTNNLSRSIDCSSDNRKLSGIGSGILGRALQQSMIDESRRASFDGRLSLDLGNAEILKDARQNPDANSAHESSVPSDLTASDTDSVSSGSTSGVQDAGGAEKGRTLPRGIAVSARFWQETNSRLRRLQDPGSPLSTSPVSRAGAKFVQSQSKRLNGDVPLSSSPRNMASPTRGPTRPASPGKLWTSSSMSPSRGYSPSRRSSVESTLNRSYSGPAPSILSFSVDTRRGKMGEDRIVDAHMLRLLYNRYLQWRFVNARSDATFMVQRRNAEKNMWNAWVTTSELRHSVTLKKIKLLLLRQKLKLTSILRGQISCLEEWGLLEKDHSSSLLGATEALQASTLRLPVVGKAIVDFQKLKEAVGSAADVMQTMVSSICYLSSKITKRGQLQQSLPDLIVSYWRPHPQPDHSCFLTACEVEEMNSLLCELMKVTATERVVLEQCKDFLSTLSAMQVKDCSLRTHIIQLQHIPTIRSLTTRV